MLRCAVVGASGYSGAELVGLLALHPEARLAGLQAESSAGRSWGEIHPAKRHLHTATLEPWDPDRLAGLDVVFLAQPHGVSGSSAAALVGRVGHVIDLSGDLRLPDAGSYRRWYGREHPAPHLLGKAVYGLPELFGEELPGADLVACAGCYATAAQIAAAPALRLAGSCDRVLISASSGTSGAGRKADVALSFSEVSGDMRPYRVGSHQHSPEMVRGLERWSGRRVRVSFTPVLAPLERGILAIATLPWEGAPDGEELLRAYRDAYAGSGFVRVAREGGRLPGVRDVVGTNFCDLAPVVDPEAGTVVVIAALDNLLKGAAGQAVQVMNLVVGLPEATGLVPMTEDRNELARA